MDTESVKLIVLGFVTIGLGCITVYQSNKGHDASLWGWATAISLFCFWGYF